MFHICTHACVSAYHEIWWPVLGATFFWILHCAVEVTKSSVSEAASSFLGQTCSTAWPSISQPGPTSVWLWALQPREAGDALAVLLAAWSLFHLGLLKLWYSAPGQSAWSSTKPCSSKLNLEGTNSKAQGRYKISLHSPARKVTPGFAVSLENTGFQFWQTCELHCCRWPKFLMDCHPKEEFTSSAIEKIDSPKFPQSLQKVNFLKEVQSTEPCQDYTQEWCWSPAWESTCIYHPQDDSDKTLQAPSQMCPCNLKISNQLLRIHIFEMQNISFMYGASFNKKCLPWKD